MGSGSPAARRPSLATSGSGECRKPSPATERPERSGSAARSRPSRAMRSRPRKGRTRLAGREGRYRRSACDSSRESSQRVRRLQPRKDWPGVAGQYLRALRRSLPNLPVGVDARHDRHAGAKLLDQRLARVEGDADRNALDHLGEVSRRIVGRQQRELRAGCRRQTLDMAVQRGARKVSTVMLAGWPATTLVSWVSL